MIFFNCRNKCRKIDCNEARQFTLGHAGYFEKIRNSQFHPQFYLTSELWKCRSLTNACCDQQQQQQCQNKTRIPARKGITIRFHCSNGHQSNIFTAQNRISVKFSPFLTKIMWKDKVIASISKYFNITIKVLQKIVGLYLPEKASV